jgi:hypothetical protein
MGVSYWAVVFIFFLLLFFLRSIAGDRGMEEGSAQHATMYKEDMRRINSGIWCDTSTQHTYKPIVYV